ncbi:hypothetical protein [Nocardia wallacei]|uniref:Uncharacterized protein n=1 Tax=Nocardia wallacei TaxID=480035 RepID=A0A7G1KUX7_9NOCA|nr:hypothetical protein [Nocardia wallacei]BCK58356.1 hypothetical protein NWFMUON74_61280 [Nocardia wallacei]
MSVQRFRPRVAVEAIQFESWSDALKIQEWAPGTIYVPLGYEHDMRREHELDSSTGYVRDNAPAYLVVRTAKGLERADLGDWIVRGVTGEDFICPGGDFAKAYEELPEENPTTVKGMHRRVQILETALDRARLALAAMERSNGGEVW